MASNTSIKTASSLSWMTLYLLIAAGPVVVLISQTSMDLLSGSSELIGLAFPSGRRLELLVGSIGLSAAVALGAAVLGVLGASLLYRWRTRKTMYLTYVALLLLVVPPYVHALSWMTTIDRLNAALDLAHLPTIATRGLLITWWVQLMALSPFAIGLSLLGFGLVERHLIDAARMLGNDFNIFRKVVLPIAAPAIAAGSVFVFLVSIMDYSIPSLFQVSSYSLEIFSEYSATYQPARAFLLALPLLLLTGMAGLIFVRAFRRLALTPVPPQGQGTVALRLPPWFTLLHAGTALVLLAQVLVPVLSLSAAVGSPASLATTLLDSLEEIGHTLLIALLAALVSTVLATALAAQLSRHGSPSNAWSVLLVLPLSIPAPLVGIGLIAMWNQEFLDALYGSIFMPSMVGVVRFMPFAAAVMLFGFRQINPLLLDAALVLQKRAAYRWLYVYLPMLSRHLLAAGSLVFALTLGELGATLLVAPPGMGTITVKIYNYLHYGESSAVASLSLLMLVVSVGLGLIVMRAVFGQGGGASIDDNCKEPHEAFR